MYSFWEKRVVLPNKSFTIIFNTLQAYHEGYYGPHYQWLHWSGMHGLLGQLRANYMDIDGCDLEMMKTAMEGVLYFTPITSLSDEPKTTVGISGYVSLLSVCLLF